MSLGQIVKMLTGLSTIKSSIYESDRQTNSDYLDQI